MEQLTLFWRKLRAVSLSLWLANLLVYPLQQSAVLFWCSFCRNKAEIMDEACCFGIKVGLAVTFLYQLGVIEKKVDWR